MARFLLSSGIVEIRGLPADAVISPRDFQTFAQLFGPNAMITLSVSDLARTARARVGDDFTFDQYLDLIDRYYCLSGPQVRVK